MCICTFIRPYQPSCDIISLDNFERVTLLISTLGRCSLCYAIINIIVGRGWCSISLENVYFGCTSKSSSMLLKCIQFSIVEVDWCGPQEVPLWKSLILGYGPELLRLRIVDARSRNLKARRDSYRHFIFTVTS